MSERQAVGGKETSFDMTGAKPKSAGRGGGGRRSRVAHVREMLLRRGMPRLQMSLILLLTGLVGFLVSFALLRAGVGRMWLRYPLAVIAAYAAFLLLLRLWLSYQRWAARRKSSSSSSDLDLPGVDGLAIDLRGADAADAGFGGGGDFAGAGAGGSWETPGIDGGAASESFSGGGGSGLLDSLDIGIDGDEGCLFVLALLLLILGGLLASVYVVYLAPALLAEILVDGLLVSGLYRRVKGPVSGDWLLGAVRRTLVPVLLTFACFVAAGFILQYLAPEARTIREVWQSMKSD